jgi:hypothetical protein
MKRRLYFLVPHIATAKAVVHELLMNHIEERHIHLIAREGTELEDLPQASIFEKSDFIPALEKCGLLGGVTGMIAGLVAIAVPGVSAVLGGGAVLLITTALGAGVGALSGTLIAVDVPNSHLTPFIREIEMGKILILVDVSADRIEEVKHLVHKHHKDADINGVEPTSPLFP